jgi:hypothetical protein
MSFNNKYLFFKSKTYSSQYIKINANDIFLHNKLNTGKTAIIVQVLIV